MTPEEAANRSPEVDGRGWFMLWDEGKEIGYAPVDFIDGHRVLSSLKPLVVAMQREASQVGVILTVDAGLRTFDEQLALRKKYFSAKVNSRILAREITQEYGDKLIANTGMEFLLNAKSIEFLPECGRPGYSNHHDGMAIDFRTKDRKTGLLITGPQSPYAWLEAHALDHGFVRTVPSERWHWEYRPGMNKYWRVPEDHPTWS